MLPHNVYFLDGKTIVQCV